MCLQHPNGETLPTDMLIEIMSFLDMKSQTQLYRVNKKLREICNNESVREKRKLYNGYEKIWKYSLVTEIKTLRELKPNNIPNKHFYVDLVRGTLHPITVYYPDRTPNIIWISHTHTINDIKNIIRKSHNVNARYISFLNNDVNLLPEQCGIMKTEGNDALNEITIDGKDEPYNFWIVLNKIIISRKPLYPFSMEKSIWSKYKPYIRPNVYR